MFIVVKPAKTDVNVRKEDGAHLSALGEKVKRSSFWVRRLKDGDVVALSASEVTKWESEQAAAKKKAQAAAQKATTSTDESKGE